MGHERLCCSSSALCLFLTARLYRQVCGLLGIMSAISRYSRIGACLSLVSRERCYVAIKALKGRATKLHHEGYMQELPILERVTKLSRQADQPAYCAVLRHHFMHPGKSNDGEHLCLVMDVLVGNVEDLRMKSGRLPIPLVKHILCDILRGLSQLHASGVVHTGTYVHI